MSAPTLSAGSNQSHEVSHLHHLLSHHHLGRLSTDMEFRDSKRVEHQLTRSKHEPEITSTDVGGSGLDPAKLCLQSEPHIVAGSGHDQEGNEAHTDGGQGRLAILLPQPDEPGSVPAHESATGGM